MCIELDPSPAGHDTQLTCEEAAAPWPHIEGIDGEAACRRLVGDTALFASMLQRLLREFSNLDRCAVQTESDQRACASRLHKLKGTAGTLGVTGLARLAAQAEEQARTGQADALATSLAALSAKLTELSDRARPALAWAQHRETQRLKQAAPQTLDPQALDQLLAQLRASNLAAEQQFQALAPALHKRLGPQAFDELRVQIDELQYDVAAASLAWLAQSGPEAESPG